MNQTQVTLSYISVFLLGVIIAIAGNMVNNDFGAEHQIRILGQYECTDKNLSLRNFEYNKDTGIRFYCEPITLEIIDKDEHLVMTK